MRFRLFICISLCILFFSCNTAEKKENKSTAQTPWTGQKQNHTLAILPFKGVDSSLLHELKNGLQKQLAAAITVLDARELPAFAFYKPRQRYIADSLLVFLEQANKLRFEKIIGVTIRDISTKKEPHKNWGILGLGSCPGESCVISSFRAGKSKVSHAVFIRRMITLALHETGHTYGLEHCPVSTCIMKDAEGKMNLDDGDSYCEKCRNYLSARGLLK